MVQSPDHGTTVTRCDETARPRRFRDANGALIEIEYDTAGRVTRYTATPSGEGGPPRRTEYVYEGAWLVQVRDPEQVDRYAYDDIGRVMLKTSTLKLAGGGGVTGSTRYRYDDRGALVAQSLPDGSELQYERNGQGQIVALHRQASGWAPFGWGRTTLVSDMQRDLVGPRSMTYGNGVLGRWQRSRAGVLARRRVHRAGAQPCCHACRFRGPDGRGTRAGRKAALCCGERAGRLCTGRRRERTVGRSAAV